MAQAIRHLTVERGIDPRGCALIAFGGAGPLHGAHVADLLGIRSVVIPPSPGLLSALGVLSAPPAISLSAPVYRSIGKLKVSTIEAEIARLIDRARRQYYSENHMSPTKVTLFAELRYLGQPGGLKVRFRDGLWSKQIVSRFHSLHQRTYGFKPPSGEVELMSLIAICTGRTKRLPAGKPDVGSSTPRQGTSGFISRESLELGGVVTGPVVITQYDSTTYVPPSWIATSARDGNLFLTRGDSARRAAE